MQEVVKGVCLPDWAICFVYGCAGQHVLQVQPEPESDGKAVVSEYGVEKITAQTYDRVGRIEQNFCTQDQKVTALEQQFNNLKCGTNANAGGSEGGMSPLPDTAKQVQDYVNANRVNQ